MNKPQLDNDEIKKLADLAKIEITETETEEYKRDINNILSHLALVNEAVIAEEGKIGEGEAFINFTREDDLSERVFDTQTIFDNIPLISKDNQVKVSKVIKK